MSKRRPAKLADAPEPFRYRPTPPPPVPGAPKPPELQRSFRQRSPRRRRMQAAASEPARRERLPAGGFRNGAAVLWFFLLLLPALALRRLSESMDWRLIAGGVAAVSLLTWFLFRSDKVKAQAGAWRTPESTLHLAELAGGWPAAFLAQRRYRHKIAKQSYQFIFWCIVSLHQFAALDCLLGWRFSRAAVEILNRILK